MGKKQIIIFLIVGTTSFTGTFGLGWYMQGKKGAVSEVLNKDNSQADGKEVVVDKKDPALEGIGDSSLSEQKLQSLIQDVQIKKKDIQDKEADLADKERRIETARKGLQNDIENMNNLYEKLTMILAALKEKEASLNKSMVEIGQTEKSNLQRLASIYDKMDSKEAAKIIATMFSGAQQENAVKIVYYMSDRAAGELFAAMGKEKPDLAGELSIKLKQIKEGQ